MERDEFKPSKDDAREIEPIYAGDLNYETIKNKPILNPIAKANSSYMNFELLINRALWEYTQDKGAIDEMIKINPKYSETMILGKIQSLLGHVKQIIHSQNIEKENMKSVINDMVKIVESDYAPLEEPEGVLKIMKNGEDKKKDIASKQKEKLKEEETPEEFGGDEEPKKFYSDLLEKEIPIPTENKKIIPISKK